MHGWKKFTEPTFPLALSQLKIINVYLILTLFLTLPTEKALIFSVTIRNPTRLSVTFHRKQCLNDILLARP
jgi:hypothetical protein